MIVLIEWILLGLTGFLGIVLDNQRCSSSYEHLSKEQENRKPALNWSVVTWAACGALITMMILGAFSIGPIVLAAVLAFGGAAALADRRKRENIMISFRVLIAGALANLVLLFALILSGFRTQLEAFYQGYSWFQWF
jgi:hypothetical protein